MDDRMRDPHDPEPARTERISADAERPSTNPAVGASVGGAAGALAGAAAGTLTAGPIGTIIGAIVGAVGGGWAGLATAQDARPSDEDEAYYRSHYGTAAAEQADASYERARPAYHLGHLAAHNPDYYGRSFDEVERDLQRGWHDDVRTRHGEWTAVRPYARAGYDRASVRVRERMRTAAHISGGTDTGDRASFSDPLPTQAEPGAPEHSGASGAPPSPNWMRQPVDQGGFGTHIDPASKRRSSPE